MSLRFQMLGPVPDDTARLVRALSRKKPHPYVVFADHLGDFLDCDDFTELYSNLGQSAIHPARLALATLVQFAEGLSDRQLAETVQWNTAVKYLLRLPLEHDGWDPSVFAEFRSRLLEGGAYKVIFEKLLHVAEQRGMLKPTKQRTDSTYILSAARLLNRLELVHESTKQCLEELAGKAPEFVYSISKPDWLQRYFDRPFNYKLSNTEKARSQLAQEIGKDIEYLLIAVDESDQQLGLSNLKSVRVLRQIYEEQFEDTPKGGPRFRAVDELNASVGSPHDPDARLASKRGVMHFGYKVHFTETFSEGAPHLITHVETTAATVNDSLALPAIQKHLKQKGMKPDLHLVDSGYVQVDYLHKSMTQDETEVLSPLTNGHSWQSKMNTGFDVQNFIVDWTNKVVTCPLGTTSERWKKGRDKNGQVVNVSFPESACKVCPVRESCTRADARKLQIKAQPVYEFVQLMRQRQHTEYFKKEYANRAGVEGTISQAVRNSGRHSPYVGFAKTEFANVITGAALNFVRIAQHLLGVPTAKTRTGQYPKLFPVAS